VIPIELPALRHRKSDIPELVKHFLARANQRRAKKVSGIDARALELMCAYDWPGNVRQLENTVQRMVLLKVEGELGVEDLPDKMRSAPNRAVSKRSPWDEPALPVEGLDLRDAIEAFESSLIRQALERVGWNKNRAAALLQMNRTTLVEKLKKKGLIQGDEKTEDG
jgi:DNA-binding NtrC family response regulator